MSQGGTMDLMRCRWTREHAEAMGREVDRLRRVAAEWRELHGQITQERNAARDQLRGAVTRIEALERALTPFAFIGRASMERLGLAQEYDEARNLLNLPPGGSRR